MMSFKQKISAGSLILFALTLLALNLLYPTTKTFAQEMISVEVGPKFNQELNCLAENIYYEAGGESFEGKLAVAQVTMNRVSDGRFKSSICGVVKQKDIVNGSMVCQFSWFCNIAHNIIRNKYQWEESLVVARKALTEPVAHDILHQQKALYFHATHVKPGWNKPVVTKIGNHIFYRENRI
jgi:spore germination cell wall hydrolase CwlJ-like protein